MGEGLRSERWLSLHRVVRSMVGVRVAGSSGEGRSIWCCCGAVCVMVCVLCGVLCRPRGRKRADTTIVLAALCRPDHAAAVGAGGTMGMWCSFFCGYYTGRL